MADVKTLVSELVATEGVALEDLERALQNEDSIAVPGEFVSEGAAALPDHEIEKSEALYKIINTLKIPQKIKLAMFGNQTARGLLIRDKNKLIPMFVLQNPRISENELYEFARNTNLSEQVLRTIAGTSEWMKSYRMKIAVVSNPKVPVDVSMKWVKFLQKQDLRRLSRSKNIPQVVANQCRRLMEADKPGE